MNFTTLKEANTTGGSGIGLLEVFNWKTFEREHYSVIRFNADNKFVTLSTHKKLTEAKAAANREWILDMQALRAQGRTGVAA